MKKLLFTLLLSILLFFPLSAQVNARPPGDAPVAPTAQSDSTPQIAGCNVFPPNNIWNTPVDTLPVHASSNTWINTIITDYGDRGIFPDFGSGVWPPGSDSIIGIPYVVVAGDQTLIDITFDYDDESDPHPITGLFEYPVPEDAPREGGPSTTSGDRHILVIDQDNCMLYEIYAAAKNLSGSWTGPYTQIYAGSGAVYDLNSNDLRPDGWTSADAAGLPILPGLVRYEEVAAGEINHPIRFTLPHTRQAYVWPARHYASSLTDPRYVPMGQRFRLRADFDTSGYHADVQVIMEAMKKYGIILADHGSAMFISGAPNENWDNAVLKQLGDVKASDFEAVDLSSLIADPDSGAIATYPPPFSIEATPAAIPDAGHARLIWTVDNSLNLSSADNMNFTASLPAGLTIDSPANASNTCGGTLMASAGTTQITLSGGSVAQGTTCTVGVDIVASATGNYTIQSGVLNSSMGDSASDDTTLTVVTLQPVSFTAQFTPDTVPVNGYSTLKFIIDSTANVVPLTELAFVNNLPPGIDTVDSADIIQNTCNGTVLSASGTVSLSDGVVNAEATCQIELLVHATATGSHFNETNTLTSNGGSLGTASDTLTVEQAPAAPVILDVVAQCDSITVQYMATEDVSTVPYTVQVFHDATGAYVADGSGSATVDGEIYTVSIPLDRLYTSGTAFRLQIPADPQPLEITGQVCSG